MKRVVFGFVLAAAAAVLPAAETAPAAGAGIEAAAEEQKPSPDASWRNDFDDPVTLERDWKFDGSRFLVPRTKFYIGSEPTASQGKVMGGGGEQVDRRHAGGSIEGGS